ncbi:MAG TPA: hypothetical protein VLC09_05935, partial [Polyangiaceae bacterium]|nr:hypothetical protein [Polyangiaceae bacterium]
MMNSLKSTVSRSLRNSLLAPVRSGARLLVVTLFATLTAGCSFEGDEAPDVASTEEFRSKQQAVDLGVACDAGNPCTVPNSVCSTDATPVCICAPCYVASGNTCVPVTCTDDFCANRECDVADSTCKIVANLNDGTGCDPNGGTPDEGCTNSCQAGACAGPAPVCNGDHFCADDTCNPTTGLCELVAKSAAQGLGCEPGASPTAGCSATCQGTTCTGPSKTTSCADQGDLCSVVSCDAASGTCTTPVGQNPGLGCQIVATKATYGCTNTCAGTTCTGPSKTSECANQYDDRCRNTSCDVGTGQCVIAADHVGEGCIPNSPTAGKSAVGCTGLCTSLGACDTTGGGMTAICATQQSSNTNQCTLWTCQSGSGTCFEQDLSGACNDNQACTTGETCLP